MWTLKEAYTKALGLGLGFDFQRVEFDVVNLVVRVDGQIPQGWHFTMFVIQDGEDLYQGVVAEQVGGSSTQVVNESMNPNWLTIHHAGPFTEHAIIDLVN
jgi:4'-phosphopantetheinyl transferase